MAARLVLGTLVAAALALAGAGRAVACSCAMPSPAQALATADVAFIGVVVAVEDPQADAIFLSRGDTLIYTLAVEDVRKGDDVGPYLTILSPRFGASCGLEMAIGERWSLYASRGDLFGNGNGLWVHLCGGNERLATGVAVPPAPGSPGSGLAPPILLLVAGAGGAVLVLWMRRRRALPTPPRAEA